MENVKKHLKMLGFKVVDKVTKLEGVVDTISFDLYGCVQAGINPGLDKEGEQKNCRWFDVSRLTIKGSKPVMDVPDFDSGKTAEGKKGPAEKAQRSG